MDGIQIGAPYRFVPSAFVGEKSGVLPGKKELPRSVTGRICYINRAHRFFQVAYEVNGYHLTECFKF